MDDTWEGFSHDDAPMAESSVLNRRVMATRRMMLIMPEKLCPSLITMKRGLDGKWSSSQQSKIVKRDRLTRFMAGVSVCIF